MRVSNKQTVFSVAVITAVGIAMSSPAIAGRPGPQVSVNAWTSCSVEGKNLNVVTKVRNKHEGEKAGNPVVTYASISGRAKIGTGRWDNANTVVLGQSSTDMSESAPVDIEATFDLCPVINEPKFSGLNADAYIKYASDGVGDTKSVSNSCGDDPETADIEPNGIKLDAGQIAAIQALCQ